MPSHSEQIQTHCRRQNDVNTQITESITSPASAIPAVTVVGVANWISSLPEIINILTAMYLFLLISHKLYVFYREWKTKKIIEE